MFGLWKRKRAWWRGYAHGVNEEFAVPVWGNGQQTRVWVWAQGWLQNGEATHGHPPTCCWAPLPPSPCTLVGEILFTSEINPRWALPLSGAFRRLSLAICSSGSCQELMRTFIWASSPIVRGLSKSRTRAHMLGMHKGENIYQLPRQQWPIKNFLKWEKKLFYVKQYFSLKTPRLLCF